MLITMADTAENLGWWHSLDVPVDHAFDPGHLLLPAHLIGLGRAAVDNLGHSDLAMMNVEIIG